MRHLTILVDMDDTIENLAEAWVAYLNARHQTSTSLSDITDWDISKAFPTLTKEQVYAPLFEDTFWSWVKPMKGASETLQKLIADGHTVLIVTSNYIELPDPGGQNGAGVVPLLPIPDMERCHHHSP